METLELHAIEEQEEISAAPVDFTQQEMDIAAFKLWRDASSLTAAEEDEAAQQRKPRP